VDKTIPLFKVFMPESVLGSLGETLLSGYLSQGKKVKEFESALMRRLQTDSLVTVGNGTAALHLALRLIGVGPGDEVLSSPLTCTATNWPIFLAGADIKWCDVELSTCNISVEEIRKSITPRTKAIMAVHWGGYPCDLDGLRLISEEFGIPIIEDCAHSFGGSYNDIPLGASGNYCAFSFQAIKHLTTVDGGCLAVPEGQLKRAKLLRWYGIDREDTGKTDFRCEADISEVGDKLHMNDVAATIGLEQLDYVDGIIATHKANAQFYFDTLAGVAGVDLLENKHDSAAWLFTLKVGGRDNFSRCMKDRGVMTSRVHERNDKHSCVARFSRDLPNVDELSATMVCIPVGWWVTPEVREYIVDCIKAGW